jgi:hypothetical protein
LSFQCLRPSTLLMAAGKNPSNRTTYYSFLYNKRVLCNLTNYFFVDHLELRMWFVCILKLIHKTMLTNWLTKSDLSFINLPEGLVNPLQNLKMLLLFNRP